MFRPKAVSENKKTRLSAENRASNPYCPFEPIGVPSHHGALLCEHCIVFLLSRPKILVTWAILSNP